MGTFRHPRTCQTALLALLLSACSTPTPPQVATSPSPTTSTSSAPPAATPSASPNASATTAPSAVPVAMTIIQGTVYDDSKNLAPDGTTVTAHSLDPTHPYDVTVTASGGAYAFPNVPTGTQIQITATHTGWTSRERVVVPLQNDSHNPNLNLFNFGGDPLNADPAGSAYFLSDHPEIESVTPVDQATDLPADKMTFTLKMSEPLDATNQRRLAAAFTIVPNNAAALGDTMGLPAAYATSSDLKDLHVGTTPPDSAAYSYRENSGFANGYAVSNFTWASDNMTATFTLNAPVKTGSTDAGEYAFMLVAPDSNGIQDPQGNLLGMDTNAKWNAPSTGQVIRYAIKQSAITLPSSAVTAQTASDQAAQRWVATHQSYTTFSMAKQTVGPKLVSVLARRNYTSGTGKSADRIELTFSEPMEAYPSITGDQTLSLNNYIFTAAPTLDAVTGRTLGKSAPNLLSGSESASTVQTDFDSGVGVLVDTDGSQLSTSSVPYSVSLSPTDPHVVIILLPANSLPLDANYIQVYAGSDQYASSGNGKSVSDPAGNTVATGGTSQSGAIQ